MPGWRNPALREALLAWASSILASTPAPDPDDALAGARLQSKLQTTWTDLIEASEYQVVNATLSADPAASSRLDTMVGLDTSKSTSDRQFTLQRFVANVYNLLRASTPVGEIGRAHV